MAHDDFPFGILAANQLKLYNHHLLRQGIRHGHHIEPRIPVVNEPITLHATTGADVTADFVACIYTTNGTEPRGRRGIAENGQVILHRTEIGRTQPARVLKEGLHLQPAADALG